MLDQIFPRSLNVQVKYLYPRALVISVTPYTNRHDNVDLSDSINTTMFRKFIKFSAVCFPRD